MMMTMKMIFNNQPNIVQVSHLPAQAMASLSPLLHAAQKKEAGFVIIAKFIKIKT